MPQLSVLLFQACLPIHLHRKSVSQMHNIGCIGPILPRASMPWATASCLYMYTEYTEALELFNFSLSQFDASSLEKENLQRIQRNCHELCAMDETCLPGENTTKWKFTLLQRKSRLRSRNRRKWSCWYSLCHPKSIGRKVYDFSNSTREWSCSNVRNFKLRILVSKHDSIRKTC